MADTHERELLEKAIAIAKRDLRWCYKEEGIWTGSRHVFWSWDSFFAGFGSVALGDFALVKSNLLLYLNAQKKNGMFPKRVAHPLYWMRFLGVPIPEKREYQQPNYANSYFTGPSIAQHPVLVIALYDYVVAAGDDQFFCEQADRLEKAFAYMRRMTDARGLVQEGLGGGWAESILRRGAIGFTNVCQARALWCMAELYEKIGEKEKADQYREEHNRAKKVLQEVFWCELDGGYLSDWLGWLRYHHFATDGNLLAVWWNLVTPRQADRIERKIDELAAQSAVPLQLTEKAYGFWRVHFSAWASGNHDYHMRCSWSWLGSIDVMVKLERNRRADAHRELTQIAEAIVRDGVVHEVYNRGIPVDTWIYQSEQPWAWAAGLFLRACAEAGYDVQAIEPAACPQGLGKRVKLLPGLRAEP